MEEAEEEGDHVGGPAVSTNLDPCGLLDIGPPAWQHTPADRSPPNIYTAEDCWVWVQLEKMLLTFKRVGGLVVCGVRSS